MIIEMIPPEYWPQMRDELNALGKSCDTEDLAAVETTDQRRARIHAEYDAAIKRKNRETARLQCERKRDRKNPQRKRRGEL